MKKKKRFTLIEMIVVIGIIALLAAMLFPALNASRNKARTTQCKSNLRQIGVAFKLYFDDYRTRIPLVTAMKSVNSEFPTIREILLSSAGNSKELFRCPADFGISSVRIEYYTDEEDEILSEIKADSGRNGKSDYENEESSYEFNTHLCGRTVSDRSRSMLMHDYRPYHGVPGTYGAANYLFADGHVGDLVRR
ncbi:MAG: prepilin-type N-terminal cleavage/methylation domain-containing protein [Victivallaceae bacterium]|nr:prepilin-type N-terminal cleavage/methylation domain-containing protein [Victivallaceae bacterium]